MLVERMLFERQADEIMDAVKAAPENEAMRGRWGEPESGMHPAVLAALWNTVCAHTVDWIDHNAPEHWTRPLFLYEST